MCTYAFCSASSPRYNSMSLHGCRVSHPLYRLPALGPKNLFRLLFPHFHSTLWIAVVSLSSEDCAIGLFGWICSNLPKLFLAIACFYCFVTHPVLSYVLQLFSVNLCVGPWGRPPQILMRHFLFQIIIYLSQTESSCQKCKTLQNYRHYFIPPVNHIGCKSSYSSVEQQIPMVHCYNLPIHQIHLWR